MFKNLDPAALGVSGSQSELIESTLSNGFKGLEIDLVDFAVNARLYGVAKAKRYLESARLQIGGYRLPISLGAEEPAYRAALEQLPERLDLVRQLRCPWAVAAVAPTSQTHPYHEHFELVRRRVGELARLLDEQDARLGLEFQATSAGLSDGAFSFIQTAEAMLMLLKTIGEPNVGLALDSWNWHVGGGTLEQLQSLGVERIVTVGLADVEPDVTAENANPARRRLPGETGVVDSVALLNLLAEGNYEGPVTPRPSRELFAGQGREKIVRQAAAALDTLWKAAGLNPAGKPSAVAGK